MLIYKQRQKIKSTFKVRQPLLILNKSLFFFTNNNDNNFGFVDKSFSTSHKIPQLSKVNRSQDFQTAHKIPPRVSRSVNETTDLDERKPRETETRVSVSVVENTTGKDPVESVVTQTSIKTSKSKKKNKSLVKNPHDGIIDIKADEGLIDERLNADEEEQNIMKKKFLKTEVVKSTSEDFVLPFRLHVPLEDEVKEITYDKK